MFYGIQIPSSGAYADPLTLAALARDAEEAGWDGFFIWDNVAEDLPLPMADPWVALAAIALSTRRIRLGPMVTALARRRPWKLARETVTLDHLCGGRLIFGAGLGGNAEAEFARLGEEPDNRVRASKLDEGLDVLAGLWSGRPFRYQGKHYTVQETVFLPRPVQSPRIPIWVGGRWPNRAPFRRAARWDGVFPGSLNVDWWDPMPPDELAAVVAYVGNHRADSTPFDVTVEGRTPAGDPAQGAAIVRAYARGGLTWWLESINPWGYGWRGDGPWPVEEMNRRIHAGPPGPID